MALVQDAPGGEFNAFQLFNNLYRKHSGAKAILQKYQGLRGLSPTRYGLVRGCADLFTKASATGALSFAAAAGRTAGANGLGGEVDKSPEMRAVPPARQPLLSRRK